MATPDDVQAQLVGGPNDAIQIYDGAGAPLQHSGWSMRDWLRTITWDLLRFQSPGDPRFKANTAVKWGLRDAVSSLQRQVDQNNRILKRLAKNANVDISDLDA